MRAVAVLLLLTACTERNPSYCNSNAECGSGNCDVASHTCVGAGGAGGTGGAGGMAMCSRDDQCRMPTPRCVSGNCVQCVGPSDCAGGHICDTGTQMCRACADDATCDISGYPGGACLAGACLPANMVAFASCWFSNNCPGDGKRLTPYCDAQAAIDSGKPVVVLEPAFCTFRSLRISDRQLQLWGRNMGLFPSDQSDGLTITGGNANAVVRDLVVTGVVNGMPTSGRSGIFVTSGATARLSHVQVHDLPNAVYPGIFADGAAAITVDGSLVYRNQGWGVYVTQTPSCAITNSFLLINGTTNPITGGTGGVRFATGSGGQINLFAFNTVAQNRNASPINAGVQCDLPVTLTDSLIPDNAISPMCTGDHSVLPVVPPRDLTQIFVNVSAPQDSLTRCAGFHVNPSGAQAGSAIGKGTPVASITNDVDGEPRATPPTVGADEPLPCQ